MLVEQPRLSFKGHHCIHVDEKDFCLRERLPYERDWHMIGRLSEYKCEGKVPHWVEWAS